MGRNILGDFSISPIGRGSIHANDMVHHILPFVVQIRGISRNEAPFVNVYGMDGMFDALVGKENGVLVNQVIVFGNLL